MATPSIEVRYEDMSVETTASVGDKQIPTVMRSVKGMFKVRWRHRRSALLRRVQRRMAGRQRCMEVWKVPPSTAPAMPAEPAAPPPLPSRLTPQGLVGSSKQRPLRIIEGASGVLRPGRFTLVLAPPGRSEEAAARRACRRGVHSSVRTWCCT